MKLENIQSNLQSSFVITFCMLIHFTLHNNRNEKPPSRQLQTRININYRPLPKLSMDLKVMSTLSEGHKFILCIIDEVTISL